MQNSGPSPVPASVTNNATVQSAAAQNRGGTQGDSPQTGGAQTGGAQTGGAQTGGVQTGGAQTGGAQGLANTSNEPLAPATSSECLIAAGAHLGMFAGFWFLAPLAIYFWKRDSSKFVTFHAVQAMLLCCVQVGVTTMATIIACIAYIATVIGAQVLDQQAILIVIWTVLIALAAVMFIVPTVVSLIAGFRAFEGKRWKMPFIGSAAERWFHRYLAERGQLSPAPNNSGSPPAAH